MSDDDTLPPLDAFSRHEVLHTAYVVARMFEDHVAGHRFTASEPSLAVVADKASAALWDFYQQVGALAMADEPQKPVDG